MALGSNDSGEYKWWDFGKDRSKPTNYLNCWICQKADAMAFMISGRRNLKVKAIQ